MCCAGALAARSRRRVARRCDKVYTGVLVTDRHHGRAGTTFTVTHVHLSNEIASHVVSMDQRYGRFACGASAARGPRLGPGYVGVTTTSCHTDVGEWSPPKSTPRQPSRPFSPPVLLVTSKDTWIDYGPPAPTVSKHDNKSHPACRAHNGVHPNRDAPTRAKGRVPPVKTRVSSVLQRPDPYTAQTQERILANIPHLSPSSTKQEGHFIR